VSTSPEITCTEFIGKLITIRVGASGRTGGDEGIYNAEDADKARAAITAFE
jgi:hypothetical protein